MSGSAEDCLISPVKVSVINGAILSALDGRGASLQGFATYTGFVYAYNVLQCPMEQLEVSLQPPAATLSERLAETKIPCVRARHQADGMGPDRVPRVIRHMQPDTKILLQGRRSAWHNFFAAGTLGYMGVSSGRLGIPFVNPATIMFKPRGQVAALGALTYGLGGMALATLSGKPL